MEQISVKLWDAKDIEKTRDFAAVLREVFPESGFTGELFRWKHLENPVGPSIITYAEDEGRGEIVAVRVFWRSYMQANSGDRVVAFQPCDTATLPAYQRKGLFTRLTQQALNEAREEGASFIYNFPNHLTKPGNLKLGWQAIDGLHTLVKPLNKFKVLKHIVSNRGYGPFYDDRTIDVQPLLMEHMQHREYWEHVEHNRAPIHRQSLKGRICVVKNLDTINWRYFNHPLHTYVFIETASCQGIVRIGWRGNLREANIVDLWFPQEVPKKQDLKDWLVRLQRDYSVDFVRTVLTRGHPYLKILRRNYFISVPHKLNLVAYPLKEHIDTAPSNWALMGGDIDFF